MTRRNFAPSHGVYDSRKERFRRVSMSTKVRMRIGLQSVREIEVEVEDADAVVTAIKTAMSDGDPVAWIMDTKETRHGIVVDKLAFIQVDAEEEKMVGFG